MSGDETDDPVVNQRTLDQLFEVWINPEIEKRRAAGSLPPDFRLEAAQVVMNVGQPPVVRLNGEVKAIVLVPPRGKDLKRGDPVTFRWDEVGEIRLGPDDPNAGHFTVARRGNGWLLAFDCRYNAEKANDSLDTGREFLAVARSALEAGHMHAFAENLFSAVELAVKAKLLLIPDEAILRTKKHGLVAGRYNRWAKLGNAKTANAKLLNRLGEMRHEARYGDRTFPLEQTEAKKMLAQADELFAEAEVRVPRRRTL